jgi:hypothetical protein
MTACPTVTISFRKPRDRNEWIAATLGPSDAGLSGPALLHGNFVIPQSAKKYVDAGSAPRT